jgi:hypothetical protein
MLVVQPQRGSIPSTTNPKVLLPNHLINNNERSDAKVIDASRRALLVLLLIVI